MSASKKELGQRIRQMRKGKKLTLEELGNQIGMTKSALSKVERGLVAISSGNLLALSKALEVSLDWLMKGEGAREGYLIFEENVERAKKLSKDDLELLDALAQMFIKTSSSQIPGLPGDCHDNQAIAQIAIWGVNSLSSIQTNQLLEGYLTVPGQYEDCFAIPVRPDNGKNSVLLPEGYAVIRQQAIIRDEDCRDNDILLVVINNKMSIKRLKLIKGNAFLISENDSYQPIQILPTSQITLIGKVVHHIASKNAIVKKVITQKEP